MVKDVTCLYRLELIRTRGSRCLIKKVTSYGEVDSYNSHTNYFIVRLYNKVYGQNPTGQNPTLTKPHRTKPHWTKPHSQPDKTPLHP